MGQGIFGLAMYFGRSFWGRMFTTEAPVIELSASVMVVLSLLTIGDGINAINGGAPPLPPTPCAFPLQQSWTHDIRSGGYG